MFIGSRKINFNLSEYLNQDNSCLQRMKVRKYAGDCKLSLNYETIKTQNNSNQIQYQNNNSSFVQDVNDLFIFSVTFKMMMMIIIII